MDLETQDHILNYQLPVAIQRYNLGLVIIDSITSNYRAEHSSTDAIALATRTTELAKLGYMLRNLAVDEDIAIVVANQVSDRFDIPDVPDDPDTDEESASQESLPSHTGEELEFHDPLSELPMSQPAMSQPPMFQPAMSQHPLPQPSMSQPARIDFDPTQQAPSDSQDLPPSSATSSSEVYAEDDEDAFHRTHCDTDLTFKQATSVHLQERFFTGWGDDLSPHTPLKNPAMGLFWSSQIACRIALKKEESRPGIAVDGGAYSTFTPDIDEEVKEPESTDEKPITASEFLRSSQDQPTIDQVIEPAAIPASDVRDKSPSSPDRTTPEPDPDPYSQDRDQNLDYIPDRVTRRTMKLVFSPWAGPAEPEEEDLLPSTPPGRPTEPPTGEVEFEIWAGGLRSVSYA